MNARRWPTILALLPVLLCGHRAAAQSSQSPRIGYVFPAGGRQGSTFLVTLGGRYLESASNAAVSGEGVQAKVIDSWKETRPEQFRTMVAKLDKLEQKKAAESRKKKPAWTAADEMLSLALRRKLAAFVGGQPAQAIAENVLVEITVAPQATPGHREIRLETSKGLTNPLMFCVGQLPEAFQDPVISDEVRSGKNLYKYREEPRTKCDQPPTTIALPATLNGQVRPGMADRYVFEARQGQRLVIAAQAQELIPYISDAVPGWLQAALTLFDEQGHELAHADHFRFHPDPVLCFDVPRDGRYLLAIRDSIYRGREDFVYRVTVGEVPRLTGIFPLGGPAGAETRVELCGWNLPTKSMVHDAKDLGPGIHPVSVRAGELGSNVLPFAVDVLPECLEKEPNNERATAQHVTLPVIVNGRIDRPDDCDAFRFPGRCGEAIVAEVHARRLGSPLDSVLRLTDAAGKQLAFSDDNEDQGAGLTTHQADSYLRQILPADGTYYLHLADAQHQGGPEYAYRLRISRPRPDFDLRIVPSSFTLRGSPTVPLLVHALRKDGFSGEIALELKAAPEGFLLLGEGVPAGQGLARLTLKVDSASASKPIHLALEGRATIDGREVAHTAVPAEEMTQAFEYRHLGPSQELMLAVTGRFVSKPSITLLSNTPVKLPAEGTTRVRLHVPAKTFPGKVTFELRSPPEGISLGPVSATGQRLEVVLRSDPAKVHAGTKGNLTLAAFPEQPPAPVKPNRKPKRQPLTTLPPIPYEIVAAAAGK